MCKSISYDIVIGNFVLAAIEKDFKEVSIDQLVLFDDQINLNLKERYSTKFSVNMVDEFKRNYPFFVSEDYCNYIKFVDYGTNRDMLINRLIRYFRIGLPKTVVDEFVSISNSVLG